MTFFTDRARDWRTRLRQVIEQHPLIVSRPSRAAVTALSEPPVTIFMGVGLCTRTALSRALPVDVLGMILAAEAVRRAAGGLQVLVLVADAHAMTNHLPPADIERRARITVRCLARVARRLGLARLVVLRASVLERRPGFRALLEQVQMTGRGEHHPYVLQQVTDVAYLHRHYGPLIKVGWTLGGEGAQDETMFDRLVEPLSGAAVGYVYSWPGRALDDDRSRASPYIAVDPAQRVVLHSNENTARKLAGAERHASPETLRAMRAHLRRLAAGYARMVSPVSGGAAEDRVQRILDRLYRPRMSGVQGLDFPAEREQLEDAAGMEE